MNIDQFLHLHQTYRPNLIAMVGLPRSGKTTICNSRLKPLGYTIINPDSYRLALHGKPFLATAEPYVWASVYLSVDALLLSGQRVVVDATNITEASRKPWTERKAEFIEVDTDVEICIGRVGTVRDVSYMSKSQFSTLHKTLDMVDSTPVRILDKEDQELIEVIKRMHNERLLDNMCISARQFTLNKPREIKSI